MSKEERPTQPYPPASPPALNTALNPHAADFTIGSSALPTSPATGNAGRGGGAPFRPTQRGGLSQRLSGGRAGAASSYAGVSATNNSRPSDIAPSRQASDQQQGTGGTQQQGISGRSPSRSGGFVSAPELLNFHSGRSGRQEQGRGGARGAGRGRSSGGRNVPARRAAKPAAYDRVKFLQANFRFLVSDAVSTKQFESDPDLMLDWGDIAVVDLLAPAPVRCPITLAEPRCPTITPCGHVFDAVSIVSHLASHGGPELRKAAPCPLCYTMLAARELRSARIHPVQAAELGSSLSFTLLRRPRDSIIPLPMGDAVPAGCAVGSPGSPHKAGAGKQQKPAQGGAAAWAPRSRAAASSALAGDDVGAGGAATAELLPVNRFAKFSTTSDPTPLWAEEAGKLARYAAQVLAEGGLEAEFEAPNVFLAVESLEARARAWAERRQQQVLEAADPLAVEGLLSAEEAGQQAVRAIKEACAAGMNAGKAAQQQEASRRVLEQEFPALGQAAVAAAAAAVVPGRSSRAAGSASASTAAAPAGAKAAAAWSDDEGGAVGEAATSRAVPIKAKPQPGMEGGSSAGGGAAGELASSISSTGALGASPPTGTGPGEAGGDFYFYQAADGQSLFLCSLNMRMLLDCYGSYAACCPSIIAKVIEMETHVMDEAGRKRLRPLAHLPLTSQYTVIECDLSGLLPQETMAAFAEELAQRERRREKQKKDQEKQMRAEERRKRAEEAAAANKPGLSATELRAMPLPSASMALAKGEVTAEADFAGEDDGAETAAASPRLPPGGVSFAALAKLGFAATGPSLAEAAGSGRSADSSAEGAGPRVAAPPAPQGVWATASSQAAPSAAPAAPSAWGSAGAGASGGGSAGSSMAERLAGLQLQDPQAAGQGAKGKKGKGQKVLFSSSQQRRY